MFKALITGINGFVGRYLSEELEGKGYEVFGIDKIELFCDNNFFAVDITDRRKLTEVVAKIKPQHVFHLAGFSSPTFAEKNPNLTSAINVGGTKNLLEAVLVLEKKPKILIISSSHVYGNPQYLPIDEKHPLLGEGVYARSRIEQEELVKEYGGRLSIVVSRSFNHTGAGQSENFVVPKIIKQIVEIKKGTRRYLELGDIDIKRDVSDVRDVVRAYRLLAERAEAGVVCNVCSGQSISLKNIVDYGKLLACLPNVEIKIDHRIIQSGEPHDICGDNRLVKKLTGWQSQFNIQETVETIYNFFLNN